MKKNIKMMLALVGGLLMIGCDEDAMFKEELYDKYVYIVSNEEQIHNLCESAVGFLIQKLKINKCK